MNLNRGTLSLSLSLEEEEEEGPQVGHKRLLFLAVSG